MKKIMTMVVAAMLATVSVNAQQEVGSFTIQPHIGGTAGMMTNADIAPKAISVAKLDKTPNGGSMAGVEFEYQLAKSFSLAAGVNYMQAGTAWKDINHDGVKFKDMKVETSYVTVPVVANVYLFKGFALKAGLQPGFKTSAKMEYKGSMGSASVNLKNDVKGFDLAVPVGLSYEFKHFVLDARYTFGLTKVFDDFDTKNLTFQLTLGYKIDL